jgi:3D (Asp-Asp-Asp) domain-containing protein
MKKQEWVFAIVLTLIVTFMVYLESQTYKGESISPQLELACTTLQGHIDKLNTENTHLATQLDTLTAQVRLLQENKQDKSDRSGERGKRRIMEVTAYWEGSCGKEPDDPEYGITASGKYVQDGYIAAGPEFKIGQKIYIPFFDKTFTVMDRGKAITNGHLDVYMKTAKECFTFGRVYGMEVVVLE